MCLEPSSRTWSNYRDAHDPRCTHRFRWQTANDVWNINLQAASMIRLCTNVLRQKNVASTVFWKWYMRRTAIFLPCLHLSFGESLPCISDICSYALSWKCTISNTCRLQILEEFMVSVTLQSRPFCWFICTCFIWYLSHVSFYCRCYKRAFVDSELTNRRLLVSLAIFKLIFSISRCWKGNLQDNLKTFACKSGL